MTDPSSPPDVSRATLDAVDRFNDAFNRHDIDDVMAAMTEDCVFVNTTPPPDGEKFEGQAAVRGAWQDFFASSPHAHFETEEIFACGDRCVVCWRYTWDLQNPETGHIRGVDIIRVHEGRVAEKLSYVKG